MSEEFVRELMRDYLSAGRDRGITRSQLIGPYGIGVTEDERKSPLMFYGSMCNYIGEFLLWQLPLKLAEFDNKSEPDEFFLNPFNLLERGFEFDPSTGYMLSLIKEASDRSLPTHRLLSANFNEGKEPAIFPGADYLRVFRIAPKSKTNKEAIENMVGLFAENVDGPTREPVGMEVDRLPKPMILPR